MSEIELLGLELRGRHGVLEEERHAGQRFLFDVWLEVGERGASDRIEDAVDYREVVSVVREVSDGRAYHLLEALAAAVADALLARFAPERVRVRVRKPEVRLAAPVEHAAVSVVRVRPTRAYVGLGSNLGDREATIRRAVDALAATPGVEVAAVSTLRETEPVGYLDQPRFLNGVAALDTTLSARELLALLLEVERSLGRTREGPALGPRTIDLDLLLHGAATIAEPGLSVPHPRLHERRFALEPLAELAPEAVVPGRGRIRDLLAGLQ